MFHDFIIHIKFQTKIVTKKKLTFKNKSDMKWP